MKPIAQINLANIPRLIFTVTVKDLKHITLSGASTISVRELSGDQLTVDGSGVSTLTIDGTVRVTFTGSTTSWASMRPNSPVSKP